MIFFYSHGWHLKEATSDFFLANMSTYACGQNFGILFFHCALERNINVENLNLEELASPSLPSGLQWDGSHGQLAALCSRPS